MRILSVVILIALCTNSATWAGDGLVALQTADPSCPDHSGNIYVNCGNGTVTDNRTGLVWLADANCLGLVTWYEAMEFVAGLKDIQPADSAAAADDCGLSDGSSSGEWRLPSLDEWEAMVADAVALGCSDPPITYDDGTLCWSTICGLVGVRCSFSDVEPFFYWSSTTRAENPGNAWAVSMFDGRVAAGVKLSNGAVWLVRSGQ